MCFPFSYPFPSTYLILGLIILSLSLSVCLYVCMCVCVFAFAFVSARAQSNSPYLVRFFGAFFQEGIISLALEYMDCGSLQDLINVGVTLENATPPSFWHVLRVLLPWSVRVNFHCQRCLYLYIYVCLCLCVRFSVAVCV